MTNLVSPIVAIISSLWPCCARHTRYLCKLQRNTILLRTAMGKLKEARDDVQRSVDEKEADPNEPKMRTEQVRGWLERVRTTEGEVEKILQKADAQLSRARCLGGCCPLNNCWSNYKIGKSIAKKIPFVDELKVNGKFEELTYRLPLPPVQPINVEVTVGMESIFDEVWKHITSKDDNKGSIIGLYGHGGVGKTTLLKKINNEFDKICGEHGFDHIVMFVVVSKPINYEAIQNKIGGKLGLSFQGDGDESRRAEKIFNRLRNKNFVILLDDIWERVDLQRIGIPSPPPQGNSSKLIFTTRSKEVCGLMEAIHNFQVECLPWDKAWRLFQDKVGNETLYSHPGIPELAELVAKECGGLPLALITIGRAMSTKKSVEEWKDAITTLRNSASEFQGMSDEVLSRLKLSYDYLYNDTIKSCFIYCALYPEDRSIYIPELIDYWIAEGFLDEFDNLNEARDRGHTIIGSLKSACLLESSDERNNGLTIIGNLKSACVLESCDERNIEKTHVKMHDVIRDLALWIVNDCKSSTNTTGKFLVASNVCERWRNAERIFWMAPAVRSNNEFENPPTSHKLVTLIVICHESKLYNNNFPNFCLPQRFFQFMPSLRVLVLSIMKLNKLPTSICELHKLQYLNLSKTEIKKLPTSICELNELQYLNLSYTGIKELPIELGKLVKLKFLDLMESYKLEKIPLGVIANLSELQCLNLFRSKFNNWELKEEGGLSFRELKKLQEVGIAISSSLALKKLLCNQNLRKICTSLSLDNCVNLKSISFPPSTIISKGFGNLTSLKLFSIRYCSELEELTLSINEDGETNRRWYSNKLEELNLIDLPRLNNIVWRKKYHHYMAAAQQQQQQQQQQPFQNLNSITIFRCGALKDLTWVVYLENLEDVSVEDCNGLETIIELGDDDGGLEGAGGGGDQMLNTGGRVFGRLKILKISQLPKLKSICRHALAFPSMETIGIFECTELKKLPLDSCSNVNNTLQRIKGSTEWWNELQWEDETTKSKFLPYHYHQEFQNQEEDDLDYFEEDPENSSDCEDQTLLRGHDEPSSFVFDGDLTFHIGIDGGPSRKRKKE